MTQPGDGRESDDPQQLQGQKFEAVGRLAGGLAHDFANLLTLIAGYSEILLNRMSAHDPLRPEMEEIRKAANRGCSLTGQLLAFTRRQVVEPQILNLNELVANMETMLRRMIGEDIILITELQPELWRVKADAGQMEQVMMNLVLNARDATRGGGEIVIRTANVEVDAGWPQARAEVPSGPHVMLTISDNGQGMNRETLEHAFETFFTTKENNKGTGLGLASVYSIIKRSNGRIFAESEPGKGATFTIYLPQAEATAEPILPEGNLRHAEAASETVLLVEDEASVRHMLQYLLTRRGYTVMEAGDGVEALALYETCGRQVDLLLTDIVMPRMGGRELAERLLALKPDLRILYMSGYSDEILVGDGMLRPGTLVLQKPLKPDVLTHKLREVLDQHPAGAASAI